MGGVILCARYNCDVLFYGRARHYLSFFIAHFTVKTREGRKEVGAVLVLSEVPAPSSCLGAFGIMVESDGECL